MVPNPGRLQEQKVPLTAEPAPAPTVVSVSRKLIHFSLEFLLLKFSRLFLWFSYHFLYSLSILLSLALKLFKHILAAKLIVPISLPSLRFVLTLPLQAVGFAL